MEELALESNAFFMGIEYLAVFCSGLMGGLCAVRKNYDLFAMLITAWLTALGGGIIRDVMLGSLPPVGISDRGFVLTALVSGLAIAVIHPEVDKLRWSMLTIDALAVGLFAVNMPMNDVPMIIRDKHLYAVPSAVGCVLTVFVCRGVQWKMLDFTAEVVLDCAIVVLVVVMRLLSVKFSIMLPGAVKRHNTYLPSESRYLKRPVIHPDAHDGGDDDKDQSRA